MPFFSVASDASNHGTTKLFPLSVRYWTPDLGVQTKVLDFYDDSDETSAAIHNQIVTKLEENGLELDMISAYSADNASVNYGRYNSVLQKLKENNNCILKANCVAHIAHNSAKHAGDRLNIDFENVVNKTFSHFSSSTELEFKSIHRGFTTAGLLSRPTFSHWERTGAQSHYDGCSRMTRMVKATPLIYR